MSRRLSSQNFLLNNKQIGSFCAFPAGSISTKAAFSSEYSSHTETLAKHETFQFYRDFQHENRFSLAQLFRDNRFFLCNCETFLLQRACISKHIIFWKQTGEKFFAEKAEWKILDVKIRSEKRLKFFPDEQVKLSVLS